MAHDVYDIPGTSNHRIEFDRDASGYRRLSARFDMCDPTHGRSYFVQMEHFDNGTKAFVDERIALGLIDQGLWSKLAAFFEVAA